MSRQIPDGQYTHKVSIYVRRDRLDADPYYSINCAQGGLNMLAASYALARLDGGETPDEIAQSIDRIMSDASGVLRNLAEQERTLHDALAYMHGREPNAAADEDGDDGMTWSEVTLSPVEFLDAVLSFLAD